MLKAILSGNYVNLGVFKLYGDETFDNVMNTTAKLILSIPHADLMVITLDSIKLNPITLLIFFNIRRNIQNFVQLIIFCWNAWLRIILSFFRR